MKRLFILMVAFSAFFITLPAQNNRNEVIVKAFSDSLQNLSASYKAYYRMWEDMDEAAVKWVRPNPDFYKLFVPPTYYLAPVRQVFSFEWEPGVPLSMNACDSIAMAKPDTLPQFVVPNLEKSVVVERWVNRILMNYYLEHPENVVGNELYFADVKALDDLKIGDMVRQEDMKTYMRVKNPVEKANAENELLIMKPNFWKYSGTGSIHFTQHGISDNWYQGGESTNALVSELKLTANYDDKQRVQFENVLEMKLGFITAPSDTVHHYKTNADLFRLYSKLGVKAFERWFYTLSAELKTQFFPNYRTNTNDMISNFLSPLQLKVLVGMDYKLVKKKINLSVITAPLSYQFVYLKNKNLVNPSSFNVEKGRSSVSLYGSEVKATLDWKIASNISLNSKFNYFTTFEKVIANWENTVEFKLNRYLSTKLFVHARYDDGVRLNEENDTYFQFKEMLTFGLTYTW